jgi:hypothetical protein
MEGNRGKEEPLGLRKTLNPARSSGLLELDARWSLELLSLGGAEVPSLLEPGARSL